MPIYDPGIILHCRLELTDLERKERHKPLTEEEQAHKEAILRQIAIQEALLDTEAKE